MTCPGMTVISSPSDVRTKSAFPLLRGIVEAASSAVRSTWKLIRGLIHSQHRSPRSVLNRGFYSNVRGFTAHTVLYRISQGRGGRDAVTSMRSLAPALLVLLLLLELATPMRRWELAAVSCDCVQRAPLRFQPSSRGEGGRPGGCTRCRSRRWQHRHGSLQLLATALHRLEQRLDNGMITGLWLRDEEGPCLLQTSR